MIQKNTPKVSIIGAGPGDPELITVKALKRLQSADVVLYDALIDDALLAEIPAKAVKIFVGKRAGQPCISQDDINLKIVQSAYQYGHAVRLKGGDPFIFGRGHEELDYIRNFDIPVEVVPGISSAVSLPLLQEVPLTRRGISESFWVLTGSTKSHQLSSDIRAACKTSATMVILMGIRKIPIIQEILLAEGKGDTPVMIIEKGARSDEKVLVTDAKNMAKEAQDQQIGTPGIIVIGEVVSLHPSLIKEKIEIWRA